ncbi:MAG: Secretion system C-terminal sorting domain, partial [Bacteroidota bacterium]
MQKIAPDNKIYMGTWNGSRRLHSITQPNVRGKGCNFIQGYIHTDSANHYFGNAMPNYPNFRLGILKGSECDTIREALPQTISDGVLIYPNPSNEWLMLNGKWLMGNTNVVVYNMIGQKELSFTFQNSKGIETINVSSLSKAMYLLQIIDAAGTKHNCKFVKQ